MILTAKNERNELMKTWMMFALTRRELGILETNYQLMNRYVPT